jgi:hypothetical protein
MKVAMDRGDASTMAWATADGAEQMVAERSEDEENMSGGEETSKVLKNTGILPVTYISRPVTQDRHV